LDKSKSPTSEMTGREIKCFKSLKQITDVRILQAEEGNCTVVLDDTEYLHKFIALLESKVYEPLPKDQNSAVERGVQKLFSKYKKHLLSG
jgi:hypothetical protein